MFHRTLSMLHLFCNGICCSININLGWIKTTICHKLPSWKLMWPIREWNGNLLSFNILWFSNYLKSPLSIFFSVFGMSIISNAEIPLSPRVLNSCHEVYKTNGTLSALRTRMESNALFIKSQVCIFHNILQMF